MKKTILKAVASSMLLLTLANGAFASNELLSAAKKNDVAVMRAELNAGADPDFLSATKFSVLHVAAVQGHVAAVQLLLDAGADVEGNDGRQTPLSGAASSRHDTLEVIKILLAAGADTEVLSGEWVMTPLGLAILGGNTEVALTLLDFGVDAVAPDKVGDSALNSAIYQKNEIVMRKLLEMGADWMFLNDDGEDTIQFSKHWSLLEFALPIIQEYHPDVCEEMAC